MVIAEASTSSSTNADGSSIVLEAMECSTADALDRGALSKGEADDSAVERTAAVALTLEAVEPVGKVIGFHDEEEPLA